MKPYKLQLLQALKPEDKAARTHFAEDIQEKMEDDGFLERLVFSDEATFHLSGIVNQHNVRIWGTQNPHAQIEHERDSLKINVFYAVSQQKVYGPFFFTEATVTGNTYQDMLENWLFPQLANDPMTTFDLRNRINRAVETITPEMLQRVWQEFNYRIDVCRVMKGAHIEAL
ncbi:hypothetical protein B7P43_G03884 [Cryptotermes secundus]|uniref:Uncharacterized protein n=1 Tax=Cryptotermes secundus TaxID=105785 RepID=A0A2J7QV74_9NEOP|nr:hypothetical protein B7P43_G03884 [Cryptotermes secundus]